MLFQSHIPSDSDAHTANVSRFHSATFTVVTCRSIQSECMYLFHMNETYTILYYTVHCELQRDRVFNVTLYLCTRLYHLNRVELKSLGLVQH